MHFHFNSFDNTEIFYEADSAVSTPVDNVAGIFLDREKLLYPIFDSFREFGGLLYDTADYPFGV